MQQERSSENTKKASCWLRLHPRHTGETYNIPQISIACREGSQCQYPQPLDLTTKEEPLTYCWTRAPWRLATLLDGPFNEQATYVMQPTAWTVPHSTICHLKFWAMLSILYVGYSVFISKNASTITYSVSFFGLQLAVRGLWHSSGSCICLLHLSSEWRSPCLWCHWAFVGAFVLLLPFSSSCLPLHTAAENHVAGCVLSIGVCTAVLYPRCSWTLGLFAGLHHSLPCQCSWSFQSSSKPTFPMLITFINRPALLPMSLHHLTIMHGKSVCLSVCQSAPSSTFPVTWSRTLTAAFESLGLRYVPPPCLPPAPTGSLWGRGLSCQVFFPCWFCQVRQ